MTEYDEDDEMICPNCGASDWRFTGLQLLSSPPIDVMRCAACGIEHNHPQKRPPIVELKRHAIPAAPPPYHLKLRWDRAVSLHEPGALGPGDGEVRLYEGVHVVFNHLANHVCPGRDNRHDDGLWFPAQHLTDFIVVAAMHGVTVEVEEYLRGVKLNEDRSTTPHRPDDTQLGWAATQRLGVTVGNPEACDRVTINNEDWKTECVQPRDQELEDA